MILVLVATAGWVTLPSDYDEWEGRRYLWSTSDEALGDTGLSGGLAFAIDESLCDELLPLFREDAPSLAGAMGIDFVSCEDLNEAIGRAMTTWSLNHPYINFYNVTDECISEGKGRHCSLAEVYIDASTPATTTEQSLAAFVTHNPSWRSYGGRDAWELGVRMPSGTPTPPPPGRLPPAGGASRGLITHAPAGETSNGDWEIKYATVTFHNHICWYLDTTFCARFREYNETFDFALAARIIVWAVWALSVMYIAHLAIRFIRSVLRLGARKGTHGLLDTRSRGPRVRRRPRPRHSEDDRQLVPLDGAQLLVPVLPRRASGVLVPHLRAVHELLRL